MVARRKRQADPYAEQSTEVEDEDNFGIVSYSPEKMKEQVNSDIKSCGHANRSVNLNHVRKYLKHSVSIGECVHCSKSHVFTEIPEDQSYTPIIWLCAFCGYQGCDRNSPGKHAFTHYRTPRSDPHCVVINTQVWSIWCYECDSEILPTSSKKLHEVLQHVKRISEMAPKRLFSSQHNLLKPSTNLLTQYSGSDSRLNNRKSFEDLSKLCTAPKKLSVSQRSSVHKIKGITNLGNTCFFNSVIQNLAETRPLTQILNDHLKSGEKITVNGSNQDLANTIGRSSNNSKSGSNSEPDEEDDVELKQMDLFLPEGGPLSLAFSMLMKDMHSVGKNGIVNPGYFFGLMCKKSTQFQGYQQQDAHELLRCLLDAIRCEEVFRIKRAILKAFGLNEKSDPNSVNITLRKLIKAYGKEAFHTVVDQIFGGLLISTVFCEDCHWSSQVFEPFMDLSLPLNEEKGKPKKGNPNEEESSTFGCFGRPSNGISSPKNSTINPKKSKKQQCSESRGKRGRPRKGGRVKETEESETSSLSLSLPEETEEGLIEPDNQEREMQRALRLTEKRRPEEQEEFLARKEREKIETEEQLNNRNGKNEGQDERGNGKESKQVTRLMAARRAEERLEDRSDEDEEDDDNDSAVDLGGDLSNHAEAVSNLLSKRVTWTCESDSRVRAIAKSRENNSRNRSWNLKNANCLREMSDADVEDNTDSDYIRNSCCPTPRHPSIVVDESTEDLLADEEAVEVDSKFLHTSNSCDHLNYSSDCSERYFTAAGPDTMDELDNGPQDSISHRFDRANTHSTTTTSGRGDNISISSGEIVSFYLEDDNLAHKSSFDQMSDLRAKVGEMKIRQQSSSRESLLDNSSKSVRRQSIDVNHSFGRQEKGSDNPVFCSKSLAMKKLKQDWIARSLTTLAPRYQCGRQECSVMSCLNNFTAPELITGSNKITCENCTRLRGVTSDTDNNSTIKSNASKQLLIFSPPAVLTLHLKRFHHVGYNLAKVNKFVQFPLVLDVAPFTSSISLSLSNMCRNQTQVLYALYGIVEHSGRLNSGHYVAYVRSRPSEVLGTSKRHLNTRPWSKFHINQLVSEMAEQRERIYLGDGTDDPSPWKKVSPETAEEEVRAGRWFHVSDTYVAEVNVEKVLKAQAYLLFYERIA